MANTIGQKELKHSWPFTTGLDANSKHEGRISNLIPETSIVRSTKKVGL